MVCVIACILSNYQKLSDIDSLSENNCKQCIARNKPILIQQSRKKTLFVSGNYDNNNHFAYHHKNLFVDCFYDGIICNKYH